MTQYLSLEATKRVQTGKQVKQLRRDGFTPIIVYGREFETTPLQVDSKELETLLLAVGGTQVVELKVGKETVPVLAQIVQRDPVRRDILHVDFYRVDMDRVIRTSVPIVYTGVAPVLESGEAIIQSLLNAIEIEALPADLLPQIEVDISILTEIGQMIMVGDLVVNDKVSIITSPEEPIVKTDYIPVIEEEEEEEEGESFFEEGAEVEVITERRGEEDEDEEE